MEGDSREEGEADVDGGVLEGVDPLEVRGSVDRDVTVDRHADDDVHAGSHEGVYQRHFQVGLQQG